MNFRILLVDPICNVHRLRPKYLTPSLGLAIIASHLLEHNYQVKIFDGTINNSLTDFKKVLREYSPQIVAFTAYTYQIKSAALMAKICKEVNPCSISIIGGVHATIAPAETLKEFNVFDFVVAGEGELVIIPLIKKIISSEDFSRPDMERVVSCQQQEYFDLSKSLIPSWELFDLKKYKLYNLNERDHEGVSLGLNVTTSRGCPFTCTFCNRLFGNVFRYRSVEQVVHEIRFIIEKFNIKNFSFSSDTFTFDRQYVLKLCRTLLKENLAAKISWTCNTRVDCLDDEIIEAIKEAGCKSIALGLESGTQELLDKMKKNIKVANFEAVIKKLKKSGIKVMANFILGLPYDDEKSIQTSIDTACRLPLDSCSFSIFVPFPGSEIIKKLDQKLKFDNNWDLFSTQAPYYLYPHPQLSRKRVLFLHKYAYFKFYFRPRYFFIFFSRVNLWSIKDYLLRSIR
ncbi:MAG: radical SAM protein [Oligoflexia bacterium]|nr:radical SAM protein [Oligoflexia bacterium]